MEVSYSDILHVTTQVQPHQDREEDKANTNNVGISRLSSPTKYYEYQATDNKGPAWLGVYENGDASKLLAQKEFLEKETPSNSSLESTLYHHVSSRECPEPMTESWRMGEVELVAVTMTLQDVDNGEIQFDKWYEEEHIDMLSQVPGWLRTRRFKTLNVPAGRDVMFLALHEYHTRNGLGGIEHRAAMSTSWRDDVMNNYVKDKFRRTYQLRRVEEHI